MPSTSRTYCSISGEDVPLDTAGKHGMTCWVVLRGTAALFSLVLSLHLIYVLLKTSPPTWTSELWLAPAPTRNVVSRLSPAYRPSAHAPFLPLSTFAAQRDRKADPAGRPDRQARGPAGQRNRSRGQGVWGRAKGPRGSGTKRDDTYRELMVGPLLRAQECATLLDRQKLGIEDCEKMLLQMGDMEMNPKRMQVASRETLRYLIRRHRANVDVKYFNYLMGVLARKGHWGLSYEAFQAVTEAADMQPDTILYTSMISIFGRARQWKKAWDLYEEMKEDGVEANAYTYTSLIMACEKGGQWQAALQAFNEMGKAGVKPNDVTYSALISVCRAANNWKTALQMFDQMTAEDGLVPSVVTYNSLISTLAKAGQWEKALEIFAEMRGRGLKGDVVTFTALINACDKGAQAPKALELFETMHKEGLTPNVMTYSALIGACAKGGDPDRALGIFRDVLTESLVKPDVIMYRAALGACVPKGKWRLARSLLQDMKDLRFRLNVQIYNDLFATFLPSGRITEATAAVDDMLAHNVVPDRKTYQMLLAICEEASDWKSALKYMMHMDEYATTIVPDVGMFNAVLSTLVDAGQWKRALQVYQKMQSANVQSDVRTHEMVIHAMGETGMWEEAIEDFEWMLRSQLEPTFQIYQRLSEIMAKARQVHQPHTPCVSNI